MIVLNPPYSARSLNRTPRPRLKLFRSPSLASTLALAALTLSTAAASRSSAARRRAAAAASREASRESNSRRRAALALERSDSNWKRAVKRRLKRKPMLNADNLIQTLLMSSSLALRTAWAFSSSSSRLEGSVEKLEYGNTVGNRGWHCYPS